MTTIQLASVALAASAMLVNAAPLEQRDVQAPAGTQTTQDWRPWRNNDDDDYEYGYGYGDDGDNDDDDDWRGDARHYNDWEQFRHRQDPYSATWNVKKGVNSVNSAAHRPTAQDGPWNPLNGIVGVLSGLFGERQPEPTYIIVQGAPGGYIQGAPGGFAIPPQGYAGGYAVPPGAYSGGVAIPPGYQGQGVPVAPGSGGARPKGWPPVASLPTGIVGTLPGGGLQSIGIGSGSFSLDGTTGPSAVPVAPPRPVSGGVVTPAVIPTPRPAPGGIVGTLQSGAGLQSIGIGSGSFSLDGQSGAVPTGAGVAPVPVPVSPPAAVTPAPVPSAAAPTGGIVGTLQSGAGLQSIGIGSGSFSLDGSSGAASSAAAPPAVDTPAPVVPSPVAPPAVVTPAPTPVAAAPSGGIVGTLQSGAGLQSIGIGSGSFSLDGSSGAAPSEAAPVAAAPSAAITPAPVAAAAPAAGGIVGTVQSGKGLQSLGIAGSNFSIS